MMNLFLPQDKIVNLVFIKVHSMVYKIKKPIAGNITIVKRMKDYSKDPTLIEQANFARKFFEKHGFIKPVKNKLQ